MNTDKTSPLAVITGASSGIGYELAKEFSRNGFDLLLCAENGDIHKVAAELGAKGIVADLATYDGVEFLWAEVQGRPVDALVLNAGVGIYGDFARELDLEEMLRLIRLNVESPVHLAKRVSGEMVARGQGRILFTSSVAATMPGPLYSVYAASKAFIQSFAEAIRNELKDTGVTVTSLMPGATETEFFARAGMEDTKVGQAEKDDPALVARQGFEALMAGKDHVVGGSFKNKVQATVARILPDPVKAGLQRQQLEPKEKTG